jgi:hypothetical protein
MCLRGAHVRRRLPSFPPREVSHATPPEPERFGLYGQGRHRRRIDDRLGGTLCSVSRPVLPVCCARWSASRLVGEGRSDGRAHQRTVDVHGGRPRGMGADDREEGRPTDYSTDHPSCDRHRRHDTTERCAGNRRNQHRPSPPITTARRPLPLYSESRKNRTSGAKFPWQLAPATNPLTTSRRIGAQGQARCVRIALPRAVTPDAERCRVCPP